MHYLEAQSPHLPFRGGKSHIHPVKPLALVRKDSEIDMPDGIVDMEAFSQILALDEADPTREFSKALVWAWCEQAECAIEEMVRYLASGEIQAVASKASYLKGSSASLGLVRVARTCQSLYHLHFPPSLAQIRSFSYSSAYSSSDSSGASFSSLSPSPTASFADSRASTATTPECFSPAASGSEFLMRSASSPTGMVAVQPDSPLSADAGAAHFESIKTAKATELLERLKAEIREASDWLCVYYKESDRYAGLT